MRGLRLIAGLLAVAAATPALAHPHVWIEMRTDVVFGPTGLITGINVEWLFDDAYTQAALEGLDADGDGVYSQAEIAPLTKENVESLKEWDYFAALKVDGKKPVVGEVTEYGQIWSNNRLALHFTLPLKEPIDPAKSRFVYRIYDPSFFIGIDYAASEPVSAVGPMPAQCRLDIKPVVSDEQLAETQEMLATKGTDWTPPEEEDFGAMFAQPVAVLCK